MISPVTALRICEWMAWCNCRVRWELLRWNIYRKTLLTSGQVPDLGCTPGTAPGPVLGASKLRNWDTALVGTSNKISVISVSSSWMPLGRAWLHFHPVSQQRLIEMDTIPSLPHFPAGVSIEKSGCACAEHESPPDVTIPAWPQELLQGKGG